jgi:CAAX prenyl protease-like protein
LVILARRSAFFRSADSPATMEREPNLAAPYLAPLFAIIGVAMLTGAFSSGFDPYYALRVIGAAGVLWYFRNRYAGWHWVWNWDAFAIGIGVFVVWIAMAPVPSEASSGDTTAAGLMSLEEWWSMLWLVFRIVGSVVTVPLAEELAFRAYLTRRLISADFEEVPIGQFSWLSFLASSALFGMLHGRWLAGMVAGMLYALTLYRRREVADAVFAHATTNALIAAYVLTTGTWSLWE